MLRGGILGAGHVALNGHIPGWRSRPDVAIVAAADSRREARDSLARALPDAAWHERAEELVGRSDLDFLDICTPPASHGALIRLGLERRLHVLCEKPLVLDPEELADLADLAARYRLVLAPVHNWKHAPILAAATRLVRGGALGPVLRCFWEVLRPRPSVAAPLSGEADGPTNWRIDPAIAGGGILVDHGWHALYVLAGWFSAPLSAASGRLSRVHRDWPVEDTAEADLSFGDATGRIFLTWGAEERRNRVEIEGVRGSIRIDGATLTWTTSEGPHTQEFPESLSEGSHHPDWFAGVAAGFVHAIATPEVERSGENLREAAVCARAIRAIQESSRAGGRKVSIASDPLPLRGVRDGMPSGVPAGGPA